MGVGGCVGCCGVDGLWVLMDGDLNLRWRCMAFLALVRGRGEHKLLLYNSYFRIPSLFISLSSVAVQIHVDWRYCSKIPTLKTFGNHLAKARL